MQSALANMRLTTRIIGGFGTILVLLLALATFCYVALTGLDGKFNQYRGKSQQLAEVGQLQTEILNAELAAKFYIETVDPAYAEQVRVHIANAMAYAQTVKALSQTAETDRLINDLSAKLTGFAAAFDGIVTAKTTVVDTNSQLATLGRDLRQQTQALTAPFAQAGNIAALEQGKALLSHLMLARFYTASYRTEQAPSHRDRVTRELSLAHETLTTLRERAPAHTAALDGVTTGLDTFADGFAALDQALAQRNALITNELNVLGPQVAASVDLFKATVMTQQEAVGAAAETSIHNTIRLAVTIAVLAMIVGCTAAVTIGRSINRPIAHLRAAMRRLADKDTSVVIPGTDRTNELGEMAQDVLVFKEKMIEADRLAEQERQALVAREARTKRLEALNAEFEEGVSGVLQSVASASGQLRTTAETMSSVAETTTRQAVSVASASEQASSNVQIVATAAEELSASIREISRQVQQSNDLAQEVAARAQESEQVMENLAASSERIGEVIALIDEIAEKTNMLALNATIESARAGDAGKGFAVVAGEVKSLAHQTADATGEIGRQIRQVQSDAHRAVDTIRAIAQSVERVREVSHTIASAVEEQNAATGEIAGNVGEAANGTQQVTETIVDVRSAANDTSNAASDLLNAADGLTGESDRLNSLVKRFLDGVRTA